NPHPFWMLQVKCEAGLVAIDKRKPATGILGRNAVLVWRRHPALIEVGAGFDANDRGAVVGQVFRDQRACHQPAKIDDLHALECPFRPATRGRGTERAQMTPAPFSAASSSSPSPSSCW